MLTSVQDRVETTHALKFPLVLRISLSIEGSRFFFFADMNLFSSFFFVRFPQL
jgi:hypothetical protein